jgi:predicted nucleic acid-binding protein
MRLAVFDTNVIVSAGLKLGSVPFHLVMDWVLAGQVQFVTCPSIAGEYREVLRRPKFTRHGFPPTWLEQRIEESLRLPDPAPWPHPLPDPKDAPFLALSHASGAWLVTGNLKHFPEVDRYGVTVLSPTEYLAHLGHVSEELEGL